MYRLMRIVALLTIIAGTAVAVSSPAQAACAGTGAAEIVSLTFNPPVVTTGGTVSATVTAQNCTSVAQVGRVQWYGRFTGAGAGIPTGCIAMDPLIVQLSLPAGGTNSTAMSYRTYTSCAATGLQVNVQLGTDASATVDTRTATVPITSVTTPPPGCNVVYTRVSEWWGGFVATVTVTNTGSAPINGWSVGFTFPGDQTVVSAWNAVVTQSGSAVTAVNQPYNRVLDPAASVTFGMQGRWRGSDAPPTRFSLNGLSC